MPWLSVIMPVYNGARYLPTALASLVQPDPDRIEIIAVDDGSTDESPRLLREWAHQLPLRVLERPRRGNWVAATQDGIEVARGDWVCFLHQDDAWAPHRLSVLRQAVLRHSTVGWVVHAVRFINDTGVTVGHWYCPFPASRLLEPSCILPRLAMQNPIPLPGVCMRRERLHAAGPLDDSLWYLADWELWIRMAAAAPLLYLADVLADFRIHAASQTAVRTHDIEDVDAQFARVQARLRQLAPAAGVSVQWLDRVSPFARTTYQILLSFAHGQRAPWGRWIRTAIRAGPLNWLRYITWSRLRDRALARWHVRRLEQRERLQR